MNVAGYLPSRQWANIQKGFNGSCRPTTVVLNSKQLDALVGGQLCFRRNPPEAFPITPVPRHQLLQPRDQKNERIPEYERNGAFRGQSDRMLVFQAAALIQLVTAIGPRGRIIPWMETQSTPPVARPLLPRPGAALLNGPIPNHVKHGPGILVVSGIILTLRVLNNICVLSGSARFGECSDAYSADGSLQDVINPSRLRYVTSTGQRL